MVEIGCWLLEFDWIEEVVSMMHRIKAKCVVWRRRGAVDIFKVCLASVDIQASDDDSLDRRDRPTQLSNSFRRQTHHRITHSTFNSSAFGMLVHAVR